MTSTTQNTFAKITVGADTQETNFAFEPHLIIVADEDYSIEDFDFVHINGETADLKELEETVMAVYAQLQEAGETDFTELADRQRHIISFSNLESILELVKESAEDNSLTRILRLGRAAGYHVVIKANRLPAGTFLNSNLTTITFK